jgi:hypothetical protein
VITPTTGNYHPPEANPSGKVYLTWSSISWERANDQNENLLFEINLAIKVAISE